MKTLIIRNKVFPVVRMDHEIKLSEEAQGFINLLGELPNQIQSIQFLPNDREVDEVLVWYWEFQR